MTYIQLYKKCLEESSNVAGGLEDFTDVLLVQSCTIEMHPTVDVERKGNSPTSFPSSTSSIPQDSVIIATDTMTTIDLEEKLVDLWRSVESNVHTDKLDVRLVLRDKEEAERDDPKESGGYNNVTNPSVKVRRSTSLAAPNTQATQETTNRLKRLHSLHVNSTGSRQNLPEPKQQVEDELTSLRRKYKNLLRLVVDITPKDGEEFLCGCCQTTNFSSNPTSVERAPMSSRACGHTICRSCVGNCHLSQMERFTDGRYDWTEWIKCPLCNAHQAFCVSDPLVNHSLCTAIAASQARHKRVSRYVHG